MVRDLCCQAEAYKLSTSRNKSLKDILSDREFFKEHDGGSFPPLQLNYSASNLVGKGTKEVKEMVGEFVSISICNIPEGIRDFETSFVEEEDKFGTWSGLSLAVRRNKDKVRRRAELESGRERPHTHPSPPPPRQFLTI